MKINIYIKLFVGDYLADTTHLNATEHGAYFLLILAYWRNGGPLPDCDEQLSNIAKVPVTPTLSDPLSAWKKVRERLAPFFIVENGVWRHKRIERDLVTALTQKKRKIDGANLTNQKRRAKRLAEHPELPTLSDTVSDTLSDTQTATPSTSSSTSYKAGEYKEPAPASQEVEGHINFPRSEEDAVQCAPFHLQETQRQWIVDIWHKANGRGGRDARDVLIRNWGSYLATEWKYKLDREEREKRQAQERPANTRVVTGGTVFLSQQIKATQAIIEDLDKQLAQMPLPDGQLYPEEREKIIAKRAPIVNERKKTREHLAKLNKQASGMNQ